jgi:hypothetical protein
MPRCIDDIDAVVIPVDGCVLRKDSDTAFALQIIGIHDSIGHCCPWSESPGLLQHLIDQRGLAMVDMRDDRDIAEFGNIRHLERAEENGGGL